MPKYQKEPIPYELIPVDSSLSLRQLLPEESNELFELTDNNRQHLKEWLDWVDYTKSPKDSEKYITESLINRHNRFEFGYGIIVDGLLVGHISLMHLSDGKDPEIGYWIGKQSTGKGFTYKAAEALTNFGFKTLKLPRITIKAQPGNIASNRIAEKLGYLLEGTSQNDDRGRVVNVWSKSKLAE